MEYAKVLAKQGKSELLLIHVEPPQNMITPPEAAWVDLSELQSAYAERLEQSSNTLKLEGYKAKAISVTGPLYDELMNAIQDYKVDLVVLGTHGRKGLDRFLLGSDAEAMLRRAHCPVLSVGPHAPVLTSKAWDIRQVLCATTFEPEEAEVAAYAQKIATQYGAELVLFHVKEPHDSDDVDWGAFENAFREYLPEGLSRYSWLRSRVASTAPGSSIADIAKERGSDLIVMGARPSGPAATHFRSGNVPKVLMEAPCPVMTLLHR